ncbi:hypothetical protein BX600DRAFT_443976 [Xylariales sp. PMI_506]|nr:hypothetical protein BX600DRAFT_443976 [Xylariales sp. PMI_506]
MKFLNIVLFAATASAAALQARHHNGRTKTKTAAASAATATGAAAAVAAQTSGTVVLTEINGVPGNECLTFRNNGEIVDAACVTTSADRQIDLSTVSGSSVLKVQRTFTADFRADLVNVDACIGFNGTDFKAEPCSSIGGAVENVAFTGGQLIATGGACASGHDSLAQMTVDTTGKTCASYTSQSVTAVSS